MKEFIKSFMIGLFLVPFCLSSQDIILPNDLPSDYVFSLDSEDVPMLITKNKAIRLKTQWAYDNLETDSLRLGQEFFKALSKFNNETLIVLNNSDEVLLALDGGGHVLSFNKSILSRIDNSVNQKNQFKAAVFSYNDRLYMYGGYGFWTFKNYITYFDNQTGQWEIIIPRSKDVPAGRWKAIFQVFNDKLYVLGGRNNPEGSNNKDVSLNDHFYFDFITQEFTNLGEINPELPIKQEAISSTTINGKKAYFQNDRAVFFDFEKDTVTSYFKKGLFKNINTKKPVFELRDTLFFIKNINDTTRVLSKFPLNKLKKIVPEFYQISLKKDHPLQLFLTIFFVLLFCWITYKLFVFKDFLKGLVLYDENRIYFEDKSALLSPEQISAIKALHLQNQLTSFELNEIISSKKFVKSHFTALRIEFIKEINAIYKKVTGTDLDLVEEVKDPNDKRYKIYKTTQQVSQKESFVSFLFKI